ncbi:hypothetical protein L6452_25836 [Arctium lappa]|uniref:Uncharacterized protein n=1 Tax=Arctium lappa TaxID=4217 RepID=A0ACB9AAY7_ARCLA|nr:hypothetical protein L6452_25836 [Arctium lappa]
MQFLLPLGIQKRYAIEKSASALRQLLKKRGRLKTARTTLNEGHFLAKAKKEEMLKEKAPSKLTRQSSYLTGPLVEYQSRSRQTDVSWL